MSRKASVTVAEGQLAASGRLFGREWMRSPLGVGAVAPSSAYLAQAITAGLATAEGPVIELGPGTGVFTAALLRHGIRPDHIVAIEASEGFARELALCFPQVVVIQDDAARIRHLTPFGRGGAAFVICGLPLLSMPSRKVLQILSGCMTVLRPGGELRLFTYGPRCPVSKAMLSRLGLVARNTAFVPLNMPPAWVYTLQKPELT